jgi:hypothetical protein
MAIGAFYPLYFGGIIAGLFLSEELGNSGKKITSY